MAYNERDRGRGRWRDDRQDEGWGRETQWRGDQGFGGGWGNQTARGSAWRPSDEPFVDPDRFGGGFAGPDLTYGGPGFDAGFGGTGFDRTDVSSAPSPVYGGRGFGSGAREYMIARHDPHYSAWRSQQIAELDRDYDEYRRENQSRFDREFGAWREKREQQRQAVGRITEHMEVVGSDDGHVGTVDCTRGDRVILTKSDQDAGGLHRSIPCGWIERVGDKVVLNIDAEEAKRRWQTEGRSRALFERERDSSGPHVLNRSFAGTYPDEE